MKRPVRKPAAPDFSALPAVDLLVRALLPDLPGAPHGVLAGAAREVLAECRAALGQGGPAPSLAALTERALARARSALLSNLRPVLNATGILVHTNLGRVPLAPSALKAIQDTASGYNNLEFDLETGRRGSRQSHLEGLLCELTGAPAALVVNNCAAAVLLAITALARGREVIVSRGELVEIGGSFRMPDIMEAGGAKLREVGTTNRTRIADYQRAVGAQTGLLLKVHKSNFEIRGFTEETDPRDLVALGRKSKVPVLFDLGSGLLLDSAQFGLAPEPTLRQSLRIGFDLIVASGDKLLGGPQAGLVLGRRKWVDAVKKHPLARAVRPDKLTLAALEATLRLYRDPAAAAAEIPFLAALMAPLDGLERRAQGLADAIRPELASGLGVEAQKDESRIGGGSLPVRPLETRVLAITGAGRLLGRLETLLRAGQPPVVARIQDGALKMDLRTISPNEDPELLSALRRALRQLPVG